MKNRFENISVLDFAQHIRKRPGMFFGKEIKLTLLENMLFGFGLNSRIESSIPFQYFNYWTKKKLNKFGATYNWAVAILESCDKNEEKAFWKFYELLDEFIMLKPKKYFAAELTTDNLAFYYSLDNNNKQHRIIGNDNRYILDPAPYHIKLFDFGYCVHSYHFDYYWLVDEYDKNIYYNHFENYKQCKKVYKDKFNISKWKTIDNSEIQNIFIETINNCRNREHNII
jgi:hypothetical protein